MSKFPAYYNDFATAYARNRACLHTRRWQPASQVCSLAVWLRTSLGYEVRCRGSNMRFSALADADREGTDLPKAGLRLL